jgi:hypothetical protein
MVGRPSSQPRRREGSALGRRRVASLAEVHRSFRRVARPHDRRHNLGHERWSTFDLLADEEEGCPLRCVRVPRALGRPPSVDDAVVRRIVREPRRARSFRAIADSLNANGVPRPRRSTPEADSDVGVTTQSPRSDAGEGEWTAVSKRASKAVIRTCQRRIRQDLKSGAPTRLSTPPFVCASVDRLAPGCVDSRVCNPEVLADDREPSPPPAAGLPARRLLDARAAAGKRKPASG